MCTIIARESGDAPITQDMANRAHASNPDGWGTMWPRSAGGKQGLAITPCIHKRYTVDASSLPPSGPVAAHWRFATHGGVTLENCHPFTLCGGKYALMHNGIFGHAPDIYKGRSDTWHMAHLVIAPILAATPDDAFQGPELLNILESLCGRGNKVLVMRDDGATIIAGRAQGIERDGLWHSNHGGLAPAPPAPTAYTQRGLDWSKWDDDDIRDWRDTPRIHDARADEAKTDELPPLTLRDLRNLDFEEIYDLCLEDTYSIASIIVDELL